MEHQALHQSVTPHLQRVLKRFQNASVRSLSGPNGFPIVNDFSKMSVADYRKVVASVKKCTPTEKGMDYDPFLAPPPFPIQQMPVFSPVDSSRSERGDTILEGETISCFLVGGEKRLCLPQILNTVLRDFTLQQINAVCDDLHIFCSRCSPEQLDTLKVTGILPLSAPSCGLITKTDAERLTNALLHRNPEKYLEPPSPNSFKVYHECFGKCKGIFHPELYTSPDAKCIQCMDCHGLFCPPKFVCHSHKALENRTCHWGFDSTNWRSYLLLTKDQDCREELRLMKARFDPGNKYKRKQSPDRDGCEGKRLKGEGSVSPPGSIPALPEHPASMRGMSAFQPWSPTVLNAIKEGKLLPTPPAIMREGLPGILPSYLHTGPPVLLHPERVVPYSESERYERHFTPNVALAPPPQEKGKSENGEVSPTPKIIEITDSTQLSPPRSSKDYREYDLPTDTDDSSIGQSSPSDGEEAHAVDGVRAESSLEAEMVMIRRALDGKIPNTKEAKDTFLHEFSKLRTRQVELLNTLTIAKNSLQQEVAAVKGRMRDGVEKRRNLQKELERIRIECECRLHDREEEKERLMKEIDVLKSRDECEVHEKFIQLNRDLANRLKHFESAYHDAERENAVFREELKRKGINISDLLQSKPKYTLCNGTTSKSAPRILSPEKLPEGIAKQDFVPFRHPKCLPPKKEREHVID
ncbi:ski oncogene-like isoform X1 [Haliotis cracherodii]|uniref:ski oncogene-like isoform X1 n=1 Tax=Haliotis cracherodii TaxID=6455 RepID=UPI0039E74ECE